MSSRDLRGLIQVPDKRFFDLRQTELRECRNCNKIKNIPKINNGLCDFCFNGLLK